MRGVATCGAQQCVALGLKSTHDLFSRFLYTVGAPIGPITTLQWFVTVKCQGPLSLTPHSVCHSFTGLFAGPAAPPTRNADSRARPPGLPSAWSFLLPREGLSAPVWLFGTPLSLVGK